MKVFLVKLYYLIPYTISKMANWVCFVINRIGCGKNLKVRGIIHIVRVHGIPFMGKRNIYLGDDIRINSSFASNPITESRKTVFYVTEGAKIRIGNRVGISNSILVAQADLTIEDDVMIGAGCKLYTTDFHSTNYEDRISHVRTRTAPIIIREGAFIGANSSILKGVIIGIHSIIGAGSLVTKDVPDGEI